MKSISLQQQMLLTLHTLLQSKPFQVFTHFIVGHLVACIVILAILRYNMWENIWYAIAVLIWYVALDIYSLQLLHVNIKSTNDVGDERTVIWCYLHVRRPQDWFRWVLRIFRNSGFSIKMMSFLAKSANREKQVLSDWRSGKEESLSLWFLE